MSRTGGEQRAWSGLALVAGGVFMLFVNAVLTPLMQSEAPFAVTAASKVFFWRQSLSALVALLLLAGSVGLHLRQSERSGSFGVIAFMSSFLGSAFLLANEWCQVFFVHGLAQVAPYVLEEIDAATGPSLYDIGAMIALVTFALGWILFSISMLLSRVYTRRGPILVIAGFFAIPVLTMVLPGVLGSIVGNVVLASGWILLGYELLSSERYGGA